MPTLSEKHELLSSLNRQDAAAIVALIDLKTEDDMEKVLNKLDFMAKRLDAFEKVLMPASAHLKKVLMHGLAQSILKSMQFIGLSVS